MKRVGLTGGIATGKSHVRAVFEALGVPTIDADVLAHQTVAPGSPAFDAVKATFPDQRPLYELDNQERPTMPRPFNEFPTSSVRPEHLRLLAWDPDEERLIKISLPFWILRMHKAKLDLGAGEGFDLEHLNLDGEELARIGPALVFDYREPDGARVLLWTQ